MCCILNSISFGFPGNQGETHGAMKKSAFVKVVMQNNKNNIGDQKMRTNRFLITINILGSAGPIRFVVNETDLVSGIIATALKSYAREERLPVLGSNIDNFLLYCANAGFDAMSPLEPIGSSGARNFVLCKRQVHPPKTGAQSERIARKGSGRWKAWLNKSLSFKI